MLKPQHYSSALYNLFHDHEETQLQVIQKEEIY
jgi:hypothetical protein